MPAFSYKDWVGRRAKVARQLINRAGTTVYEVGDLVWVRGYDAQMKFSVSNLAKDNDSYVWGVAPKEIELIDQNGRFLREKIFRYLIQSNAFKSAWVKSSEVAEAVKEEERVVSYLLRSMFQERVTLRRTEGSGWGYRPRYRHVRDEITTLDKLLSGQDYLGEIDDAAPHPHPG